MWQIVYNLFGLYLCGLHAECASGRAHGATTRKQDQQVPKNNTIAPKRNDACCTEHGDRREFVVGAILNWIVVGHYKGGDRLVAQEIAKSLDVSITPVREALAELTGIGIVDFQPNRGATVHHFTEQEIREVSRVRRALECEAVRGAIGRIPPTKLHRLHEQFSQLVLAPTKGKRMITTARDLDSKLHDLIAFYCGNSYLQKELSRLSRLFRSFRDASWVDAEARDDRHRLSEEAQEHLLITEALIRKDRSAAVKAMGKHISISSRYWSRSHPSKS